VGARGSEGQMIAGKTPWGLMSLESQAREPTV
jgi:hypothetical protein